MKQKGLLTKLVLLVAVMLAGAGTAWAEEETITSFTASDTDHSGWTINNSEYATAGGGYYKLISSDASIVTPSINWSEYTNITITISARKFGGPDATQGKISVSQGETELASYSPSGTSIVASSALPISPNDGTITISCPGASSSKGCGVQSIVIKGTKSSGGGDIPTTYTVTYDCNGGTSGCPDDVANIAAGTSITLADAPTKEDNTFNGWNDGNTTYEAGASYTVNGNVTMTAQWTANGGGTSGSEQWVLTSLADLSSSDVFVIVGNNGSNYAMSNDKGTSYPPTAVEVTVVNNEITGTVEDNIKWNISGNATDGYTFYPNGDSENWLYCTNSNNGVRVGTNNAKVFIIDSDYLKHSGTSRYVGIYNSQDWRCYTSINTNISGQTFAFYKYVDNSGVQTPSITASNVSIAYDSTTGEIAYTLKNEVSGGTLSASVTAGDWLTLGSDITSPITFTCSANTATEARTATVTLTYTYGNNETVTKDVTVTQAAAPVIYTTIPDIFAAATSTQEEVNVTFNNWVVSGVTSDGKTAYVTDNNGNGFIIYTSNHGFEVNDKLSGTVSGTPLKLYNGSAEFTNLTASTTGLTVSNDGSITVIADKAIADLGGVNTGAVISLSNLTFDGTNLSDGTNTIKPYTTLYNGAFESGKTYNVTGVYLQFNTTKEILPRSAADIEEVVSTEPSITVDPAIVNVDCAEHDGTLDITYENLEISDMTDFGVQYYDAEGEEVVDPDWIEVLVAEQDPQLGDGYVVSYYMVENEGEARTAYCKVFALDDNDEIVYSNLITITQAEYVAPEETIGFFVKVTSTDDITSGQYLIVYEDGGVAFDGSRDDSNDKLDAVSNTIDVTIENGMIEATTTNAKSVFTIDVTAGTLQSASGKYIGVTSNSNGLKTSDDATAYNHIFSIDEGENVVIAAVFEESTMTLRYNKGSNQNRFRYYSGSQQAIQLYKFVADADDVPVTISAAGYATYCSEKDLDFSGTGLTAYKAIATNSEVSFKEVKQVPAGQGVLLKGAQGEYSVPVAANAAALTGNKFVGVTEETTIDTNPADGIYVLMNKEQGVGFYKTTGTTFTLGAHTAYIPPMGSEARSFIGFDNTTTAIDNVAAESVANGEVYNLQGQRVTKAQKGLYIMNGKKVVIK